MGVENKLENAVKTVDPETSRPILDELTALGIRVELGRTVAAFEPSANEITAVLDDGRRIAVDFVLTGVGVRPRSELAVAAGLTVGRRGHIVVAPTFGGKTAVALAGPANKQGRIAANAIFGDDANFPQTAAYTGTFGASILKLGAVGVGSVG